MSSGKRTSNFTSKEETILIALVQQYRATIECRKTDAVSNQKKMKTWSKIAREFNSASGLTYRDEKMLKNKYDNIKKRSKKKAAEEKSVIFNTGGGPPKNIVFTPVEEQVKSILGVRVDGLSSEFDDDTLTNIEDINVPSTSDDVVNQDVQYDLFDLEVESSAQNENLNEFADDKESTENIEPKAKRQRGDWSKGTPKLLKTLKSAALQTPSEGHVKKREMGHKMEQWVKSKSETEQAKARCTIEESMLRRELMKKKHEKKMEILELEYQAREKREADEHKLRMDLLRPKNKNN